MGVASDTFADITRKQYDDWMQRYYPKLQGLMELSTSGQLMNNQLARADATQQQALNTATVGAANQQARYGATQQNNGADNSLGLKAALATAGAKNGIRDAEADRQMNILTGGSASLRNLLDIGSDK
ncbi:MULTISPECIES: hypothetical protein [Dickeya]|uniref:DNA transfer protein n=1 Tax=Dickeya undicola TaxID=1577887 RepID=A0A3N0G655_9GAMM|nr:MULTISPECIES: hypothetical protein [Dickeya]MBP2845438.1 hypothetical protein [Dickeya oryzae]RNM07934.1 hypothetical protein EF878_05405 [Dickeya undicola]UCZ75320.1 hypothetical protein LHK94_20415 [Dickeya zeae]